MRGRETPGAVGQHAKPEAERSRVGDRRDLDRLARRAVGLDAQADVLAAIAVDPDIGVSGAGGLGTLDRERRQLAELADVELGGQRPRARDQSPFAERGPDRRAGTATTEKCPSRLHRGRPLQKHDRYWTEKLNRLMRINQSGVRLSRTLASRNQEGVPLCGEGLVGGFRAIYKEGKKAGRISRRDGLVGLDGWPAGGREWGKTDLMIISKNMIMRSIFGVRDSRIGRV